MKPAFLVLSALVLAFAPARAVLAADPSDVQKDLATLKEDVQKLQASQKPMHDADEAFRKAEKALSSNKDEIQAKADAIKDGEKRNTAAKKKLQEDADKHGGLASHPELPGKLHDMDEQWAKEKGALVDAKTALEKKRSDELQPAYNAAKADKEAKDRAHDVAAKQVELSAKKFGTDNCQDQNGLRSRVLGGIGRGISGLVSSTSDDCREVQGKLRGGLCKNEKLEELLAQVGIDPKSKDCAPASGQASAPPAAQAPAAR